ncbi:MAG TPA: dodecin family protein [Actinomycetota bacterium]|jgi:flavin-binding protein dodecin|nr:dodecin family protein [Actinomycetota bacterium]
MSVEKSIDLTATGPSVEEAVAAAIGRAGLTVRGLTSFEIERIEGVIEEGEIRYKVHLRLSFIIKERVHE